ncbi:phosphatidylinositol-4-kinase catalytic subunit [Encephalitozoon intestinalis ATCC 50506]|uniref:Phosphatidylinositol-4-kinase catalytic subunit n=1 Tax=Encephalitozoon intestinalis (strain ATCC 50506) TaxID=876142 RepID=E0S6A8_ENCIT|nr:phosphatidylinositol-4-kinase catalytic subunit [Encephalitozoon intestinalis ATCC 50506]ADM11243.1 phosphatidylinositol-4-kinase catalytic subunit [Encephalitozoon intestinalis ATCC 50506]UTX44911.1 phosphatidylinositol 4-kinase [Encephalitozoon intestinalis]
MDHDPNNASLRDLLSSPHTDLLQIMQYMHEHPSVGVWQYICSRIRHSSPQIRYLPQLVHVFLYNKDRMSSKPMHALLSHWAGKDREFCCALYFHLRSALESNSDIRSISCYFLICDIFETERKRMCRNTRILELQYRYKTKTGRTLGTLVARKGYPPLRGILLFFVKAVSWMVHPRLFKRIHDYEEMFLETREVCNINVKRDLRFGNAFDGPGVSSSISFLESLVEIPSRLKKLPRHLRQRGLDMEIKLLNHNLPAKVSLPFHSGRFVLTARVEESFLLDSAENSPFLVVFETALEVPRRSCAKEEIKDALFLKQQLDAVNGLSSLSEINVVKENVMTSIEKILMTERYENTSLENSPNLEAWRSDEEKIDKHLDDIHVQQKISKNSVDAGMLFMNHRSYSAGQLAEGNSSFGKSEEEKKLGGSASYRRHSGWILKKAELRRTSLFNDVAGWTAESVIVKTGNSLRQELMAHQVLQEMKKIWRKENSPIWVQAYQIYLVSDTSGIIETVVDALSIHKIKKKMMSENKNYSLKNYFTESFEPNSEKYRSCLRNFLYSLVGYSLATYILQVKDRHNGNIMIDGQGHIIHVDFGFIMGNHPGFYCVEAAPFKFSKEYLELLEGLMDEFKDLFLQGYMALRKHSSSLFRIMETMPGSSSVECFNRRELQNFKDRFRMDLNEERVEEHVTYLINKSLNSMGTGLYDSYQYFSYGYL